jgi:hypothetical protein
MKIPLNKLRTPESRTCSGYFQNRTSLLYSMAINVAINVGVNAGDEKAEKQKSYPFKG